MAKTNLHLTEKNSNIRVEIMRDECDTNMSKKQYGINQNSLISLIFRHQTLINVIPAYIKDKA